MERLKRKKQKRNRFEIIRNSLLRITVLLVIIGLNWAGLSAVLETFAYYNDTETSSGNSYQAGTLDFLLSDLGDFSPSVTPSNPTATKNISIENEGSLSFKYQIKFDNVSGTGNLCNYLILKAELEEEEELVEKYNGLITGDQTLLSDPLPILNKDEQDDWTFTATFSGSDPSLQNQTCTFNFVFNGTQIGGAGFSDQETLSNTVTSGTWASPSLNTWTQTTQIDFNNGTKTNVVVVAATPPPDNNGDVVLAVSGYGSNLAKNKTATANSSDSAHTPAEAFDGNNNTYWKATGESAWWLMVDLGGNYTVGKVTLLFQDNPSSQRPRDYQLQLSQTGSFSGEEIIVANVTGNASEGPLNYVFDPQLTRYLRLYITSAQTGGVPAVREFEVYSPVFFALGTLESQSFNGGAMADWRSLEWDETLLAGTDITFEVATSNNGSTWSGWSLTSGTSPINLISLPETRYIKWRATLTTSDTSKTPVLNEVRVIYYPGTASEHIVLNEFLPNPSGTNPDYGFDFGEDNDLMPKGEWVEIYNKTGGKAVDLAGWYIKDQEGNIVYITSSNTNTGSTVIGANGSGNEWLVVYMNGEMFNNNGDIVYLYDLLGNLIDSNSYTLSDNCILEPTPGDTNDETPSGDCPTEVPGNKSYARIPDGVGIWYDPIPTPGSQNKLEEIIAEENQTEENQTEGNQEEGIIDKIVDAIVEEIISDGTTNESAENPSDNQASDEPVIEGENPVIDEATTIEETPTTEETIIEGQPATEEQPVIVPDNNSDEQAPAVPGSDNGGIGGENGGTLDNGENSGDSASE